MGSVTLVGGGDAHTGFRFATRFRTDLAVWGAARLSVFRRVWFRQTVRNIPEVAETEWVEDVAQEVGPRNRVAGNGPIVEKAEPIEWMLRWMGLQRTRVDVHLLGHPGEPVGSER